MKIVTVSNSVEPAVISRLNIYQKRTASLYVLLNFNNILNLHKKIETIIEYINNTSIIYKTYHIYN